MKLPLTGSAFPPARLALVAGVGAILVLAAAVPLLAPGWRVPVVQGLSLLCHQIPERSFAVSGVPLGLCHRCVGVGLGFLVGFAAPWRGLPRWRPPLLLAIALAPLAVDWLLGASGVWDNTAASRVITGGWAGVVLAGLVVAALLAPTRVTRQRKAA
jgi:uncharacterized membrane protein